MLMKDQTQNFPAKQTRKLILPYWKEFCDLTRADQAFIDSDKLSKFYRFCTRHRLATKLTSGNSIDAGLFSSRNTWKHAG